MAARRPSDAQMTSSEAITGADMEDAKMAPTRRKSGTQGSPAPEEQQVTARTDSLQVHPSETDEPGIEEVVGLDPEVLARISAAGPVPMRPVALVDIVMELPSVHPVVVLKEVDEPFREIHIPIGQAEGIAMAYAWRNMATARPLTHELFATTIERLGGTLEAVRITSTFGGRFSAQLVIVQGPERIELPARPSDAITLALRQPIPVPIVAGLDVLEAAGLLPVT
jgi:bifunctional DNase/RNase